MSGPHLAVVRCRALGMADSGDACMPFRNHATLFAFPEFGLIAINQREISDQRFCDAVRNA